MLTLEEGTLLVKLARKTIENYVRERKTPPAPEVSEKLRAPRGVFVTLTKAGQLRGCIGYPLPIMPLVNAVIDCATSSATKDPRFPPVKPAELAEIEVEVSVLTPPEEIKAKNPREYPKHVKIGKDGLIVECDGYAGLLLPQVPVEEGWDVEEFLSCTCMKAGLPPDYWLKKETSVKKFSAQVFRENGPNGEVEERELDR
jgi:hypothetical protein